MASRSTDERGAHKGTWAAPIETLSLTHAPEGAVNLNVHGRNVVGPLQGFGQLWQKTYTAKLTNVDVTPTDVIEIWKSKLPDFMPEENRFYPSITGVQPGEVLLINATLPGLPGGVPVSTGVLILYADDETFTVMTPEGHPESGFNTFSAFEIEGATVAQIQSLARANDPLYEFGFRYMNGSAQQEMIWHRVLRSLSAYIGATVEIQMEKICIDPRLQWSQAKNIWHNALIRTTLFTPVRIVRRAFGA